MIVSVIIIYLFTYLQILFVLVMITNCLMKLPPDPMTGNAQLMFPMDPANQNNFLSLLLHAHLITY